MSRFYSTTQLASLYDQARRGHPDVIAEIIGRFPLPKNGDILDIGCGTGNETLFLQKHAGRNIWAVDKSRPMLNRTKQKLGKNVHTELGDFENLVAFQNDRFAYIFSSFTYHHASSPMRFFLEVNRILQPSGRFVLLGATLEQAQQKPLVQYFPALSELDAQRYLSLEDLIEAFWESGFVAVCWQSVFFETRTIDEEYLTKVESCLVDSSLKILKDRSENEFTSGIRSMRQEIGRGLSYEIERTVISGVKPIDLQTHREKYFKKVFPSTAYHDVSGGALNNVLAVNTIEGKKLITKQGTVTSAKIHIRKKLKSMSPERTRDEYTSLLLLNSQRDSIPVRIPIVYEFDELNNVLFIEDIRDRGILMSEQGEDLFNSRELENAKILGELLGSQHQIFRNRCPYICSSELRDLKKWKWILELRTTDLLQIVPDPDNTLKLAIESKVQDILAKHITNTLVNPDLCPKNIFIYDPPGTLGVFDFEFCVGIGDPMYDLGFLVAHLIVNTGIYHGHFSKETSLGCCDRYQTVNPTDYRESDVIWYAACTLIYRYLGASTFSSFQGHNEAPRIVEAAQRIIKSMGGNFEELVDV